MHGIHPARSNRGREKYPRIIRPSIGAWAGRFSASIATRGFRGASPTRRTSAFSSGTSLAGDIHAPGFYVHISPQECFLAVGIWRPDPDALYQIRQAIVERPDRCEAAGRQGLSPGGSICRAGSLTRPPRDFRPISSLIRRSEAAPIFWGCAGRATGRFGKRFGPCRCCSAANRPFMRSFARGTGAPFRTARTGSSSLSRRGKRSPAVQSVSSLINRIHERRGVTVDDFVEKQVRGP